MPSEHHDNSRIAKNTVYLYFRTILIMLITLYTSRVILNALGVEDFGIYNAVGGVISMFAVLTGALSAAVSRFITYELGKNGHDEFRLKTIFSACLNNQLFLGVCILVLGETLGLWFLNYKMNIPPDRMIAANWVLQCSLLSFIINLLCVPFNATIIAHEHMNAYAVVSILDAALKLAICYLLTISSLDKLAFYAVLHVLVAAIIQITYVFYCRHQFRECKYVKVRDKNLTKQMFSFAGFSFLNNSAAVLNTHGLNILINVFFGVVFNAARGIASQVEGAIMQLVNNVTVAVNPQITKSYASGNNERVYMLVCRGTKYSYFLMMLFAVPVFFETNFILTIWLKIVPDYAVLFLRLSLIGAMIKMLGYTGYTACMATGNIKEYSIWITVVGILAFPLTWLVFKLGAPAEAAYYVFIVVYIAVEIIRLLLMKKMLGFPPMMFVKEVLLRIIIVTPFVVVLPILCVFCMEEGWGRLFSILAASTLSSLLFVYLFGLSRSEKTFVISSVKSKCSSFK